MFLKLYGVFIFIIFAIIPSYGQLASPLINGHAHNDYEKARPALTKSLQMGFVSIEIDVFPVKEQLKVAHISIFLPTARDLEQMYFVPLTKWIAQNKQLFQQKEQRLTLMIDVKKDAQKSYHLIRKLCVKYDSIITKYYPKKDSFAYGYVDILISGNKPHKLLKNDSIRYMQIDGSLNQIGQSAKLYPRVSTSYGSVLKWRGIGTMPLAEIEKVKTLVEKTQQSNQKLRLWGMPNNKKVWKQLLDLGVDWMNVDNLKKFKKFYAKNSAK